jgi:hypothetical protein
LAWIYCAMTKFQFLLISAIASSIIFLLIGSRDGNSLASGVVPFAIFVALSGLASSLANRFIPLAMWENFAGSVNHLTGKRIFKLRKRRSNKAKTQRLLPPSSSSSL